MFGINIKQYILLIFFSLLSLGSVSDSPILTIEKFPQLVVYKPKIAQKARMVVFLHGSCSVPKKYCSYFLDKTEQDGNWLICPGGTLKCKKPGKRSWDLKKSNKDIENSIDLVKVIFENKLLDKHRTVIGFSYGSFAAAQLIQENNKYDKAILLSGFIKLDPKKLKNKRIILGAGRRDMTYGYLQKINKKLIKNGINSKFIDLGEIGHELPKDISEKL